VEPAVDSLLNAGLMFSRVHEPEAGIRSQEVIAELLDPDPVIEHLRGVIHLATCQPSGKGSK
jgi:hypothetical protein